MRMLAAAVSALCACSVTADAQVTTEAEKRKALLPYIRATTDCVAREFVNSQGFKNLVLKQERFSIYLEYLARNNCIKFSAEMSVAHDNIYGGNGVNFFNNAYLPDLERAVRSRIKTQIASVVADEAKRIERQRIEEAKQEENRREQLETAKKVTQVIKDRTFNCVRKEAGSMLVTNERAETIARAAAIFCKAEINALAEAVKLETKLSGGGDIEIGKIANEVVVEIVTAEIIKIRAEMIRQETEKKQEERQKTF